MPPVRPPARRMGIRMGGLERPLEDLIRQHTAVQPSGPYTLIEIGSAGCVTLRAFADILKDSGRPEWRAIGFDLTPDKAWSLDMDEVRRSFDGLPRQVFEGDFLDRWLSDLHDLKGMALALMDDPRTYLAKAFCYQIDFAFIDASHGKSCALDFRAIELKVAPGGVVVFHDYGEPEQGTDWQAVDNEFISVRTWVHRLGLNTPCPGNVPRKGWRWVGEIKGSRHWGGDGNSAAVVQRTEEPLEHQPALAIDSP